MADDRAPPLFSLMELAPPYSRTTEWARPYRWRGPGHLDERGRLRQFTPLRRQMGYFTRSGRLNQHKVTLPDGAFVMLGRCLGCP